MAEYADFYQKTIDMNCFGFKLAVGGTGIGKTRGIREVIKQNKNTGGNYKFVYVANRIQLLNEMYDDLIKKDGFDTKEVIHLERNRDTVLNALTQHREEFFALLDNKIIQKYAQSLHLDRIDIKRDCQQIQQLAEFMKESQQSFRLNELIVAPLEAKTRNILNFFKSILRTVSDKERVELLKHPIILTIFPYIAFKNNPQARVLLITIHKAFLGFFDGQSNTDISQFKENIIFLDEFDFLEADLTDLICDSPQIKDPFLFVELFHRAMKQHKLPLDVYPIATRQEDKIKRIRTRLEAIVEDIDNLKNHEGIPFPQINQFTSQIERKQAAIFQTNHTIIREPLYLQPTRRSFEIILEKQDDSAHAMILFNRVNSAMAEILYTFKEIEAVDAVIYEEMLAHCFPQSYLADQVRQISQLPSLRRNQDTRFDSLLNSGFGLYEIEDLQQVTDRDEVKFRYYAIHTTPEKVLLAIARKNLVFGLSATADIPRFVKHFNEHWIRKQLNASDNAVYFELDDVDKAIIHELNVRKLEKRENMVKVDIIRELKQYPTGAELVAYIKQIADNFEGFGRNDKNGYRRLRVERFFSSLFEIVEAQKSGNNKGDTHLLFYATFTQIEFIFKTPNCHDKRFFQIQPLSSDKYFPAFRLIFAGQAFNIIFYDAPQAKYIHSADDIKRRYHELFWQDVPVLVVTQYNSAGNGVNLQYRPYREATIEEEMDFANIHLMESPFYFFDEIAPQKQTAQEISTAIKKNIWYQAKLFEAKAISRENFFGILESLRSHEFNKIYRMGPNLELQADSLKNRLASYKQALGRVERVWQKTPDQNIWLADEVYDDFARFIQDDGFAHIREKREILLSGNLDQMMKQIEQLIQQRQKIARRHADQRLPIHDTYCRDYIHELLQRLHAFRNGVGDENAKREWLALRLGSLEHNFAGEPIVKCKAVFKTSYLQDGILYLDEDKTLYPYDRHSYDAKPWRLNAVYDLIKENTAIAGYFRSRGFELEFDGLNEQFFVPYFYQAILVGAIGEAAIKALLREQLVQITDDLPNQIFELADLKVLQAPWYIDCKNYSERTLSQFHYPPEDPAYRPKLGEATFISNSQSKLRNMRNYHKDNPDKVKLIYLNLVSADNRKLVYFDDEFNEVDSFNQAHIIVVQGILDSDVPNNYNKAFKQFINEFKHNLPYEE